MRKRSQHRVRITVRPWAEMSEDIISSCERIEKGLPVTWVDTELNFTDAANLLSTLSRKRMDRRRLRDAVTTQRVLV